MINASEAAQKSKLALEQMTAEVQSKLQKVIDAAIAQGSCKATFYPRNKFETEKAVEVLGIFGYQATAVYAKDQRDHDQINIFWG